MSNGYTQPYESLNSTAKLIRLPKRNERSKSVGRNFWNRLLTGQLSPSTTSDEEEIRRRKSDSSSTIGHLPQDLNSTIIVQDNTKSNPKASIRSSRSNSRSSETSSTAPLPTPRTSLKSSFSDSDRNSFSADNKDSIIIRNNPSHKTRTTVTVHLSKSSKTSSTPNLLEDFERNRETFGPNTINKNESLSQSLTNVEHPVTSENNRKDLKNFNSPKNNRLHWNGITSTNNRTNFKNFSSPVRSKEMIKNFAALESNRRSEENYIVMGNNRIGKNITSLEGHQPNGGRFTSHENNKINKKFTSENDRSKSFFPSTTNLSSMSSQTDLEEVPQLNSLQVFRQPKYKDRNKALRRIKQLEHLNQNDNCNEVVNQLSKKIEPNVYENQHSLKLVDFINREGFVTSSKNISPVAKQLQKKQIHKPSNLGRVQRDPIYSEIREAQLKAPELLTPNLQKKVSFRTFHEPIQEAESFSNNKKILPAKFWGIIQVIEALRTRTDEERRKIANLCYNAILTGSSHASKLFGNVDNSRWGEIAYVLLMEKSYEIRDSEGFLLAKHELTDVSVIFHPEDDPNVFVYIGRCKFNGRIGVALRLNKIKSVEIILNAFKSNK